MSWTAALAIALAVLLYLRSPIDLIPDRLGAIGLLDDLVVLLVALWWLGRRRARARTRSGPSEAGWDPHAVLGVARDASPEDITRAYREQMSRYHPDRVAHLGEELRELAHRKAVEIQRAYEELHGSTDNRG
jgi:DnaJ like chaperone protein